MKIGKIKFSICTFQFAISNITGDDMEAQASSLWGGTGATCQWTLRVNGRHASMDALPVLANGEAYQK